MFTQHFREEHDAGKCDFFVLIPKNCWLSFSLEGQMNALKGFHRKSRVIFTENSYTYIGENKDIVQLFLYVVSWLLDCIENIRFRFFYVFMLMFSNIWKNMTIFFFIIQINYLLITFKDITATMPINSLWQFLFKIKINFFLCKQCQNLICK